MRLTSAGYKRSRERKAAPSVAYTGKVMSYGLGTLAMQAEEVRQNVSWAGKEVHYLKFRWRKHKPEMPGRVLKMMAAFHWTGHAVQPVALSTMHPSDPRMRKADGKLKPTPKKAISSLPRVS